MKSKEKKSKGKAPEGKFKDISHMFQQKTQKQSIEDPQSKLKKKLPIPDENEAEEDEEFNKKTPKKKKIDNKPEHKGNVKDKLKPKSKSPSPDLKQSSKKKKRMITDSSEDYDIKAIKSDQMDIDETPKINKQRAKSSNKKRVTSTEKKKNKNKDKDNDNEIIGPLSGNTIVITGVFPVSRDELSNILKGLGAKVTGSVSSKTSILLHGDRLEDGRDFDQGNKYKAAKEKNINIYSIEHFEDYMRDLLKDDKWTIASASGGNIKPITLGKHNKSANKESFVIKDSIGSERELWTTKYQPKSLDDIVGNQKNISNLIQWLDDWSDVVLNGKKKTTKASFRGGRPQFENLNARACLITGDPGIGKTSSVRLIAKLKGYKTYETNASEQRNKGAINSKVGFLFDNTTLYTGDIQIKNLIIMDEIDGIGGNQDRGGIAALIEIIKKTKTPIICIANDRQNPKLRSLGNHCYDLKFNKPDKRQVSSRLMKICSHEGIQVEQNALEFLCESVGNDIRQCVNFIELWSKNHRTISFHEVKGTYSSFNKDTLNMISNFEAAQRLLNSSNQKMPFRDRLDLFFIDYDLIPLLIQENYLSCFKMNKNKAEELTNLVSASDCISFGDVTDKRIRQRQDWTLLADKGIMSSVSVNSYIKGSIPFPKFPEILGKMSSMRKVKRQLRELKYCFPNVSQKAIKIEVAPLFLSLVTNSLVNDDENIDQCIDMMTKHKMTMTFFKENILDLTENKLRICYDQIGSTVKSAFTREYNKSHKTIISKKKKVTRTIEEEQMEYDPDGNPIENQAESNNKDDDEDGDDDDNLNNSKAKKKTKTRAKSNNKPKQTTKPKSKSKPKPKTQKKGKSKQEND